MKNLVFIVGESGCGKSTLVNDLLKLNPNKYFNVISSTTRTPREGEVDGKDYHFVDNDGFKLDKKLQEVEFGGNKYGTNVKEFDTDKSTGLFVVTEKGIHDTILGLEQNGFELSYQIVYFMNSSRLLKSHKVSNERINRGSIREGFFKKYLNGEFYNMPTRIISDFEVDSNLAFKVDEYISNSLGSRM